MASAMPLPLKPRTQETMLPASLSAVILVCVGWGVGGEQI